MIMNVRSCDLRCRIGFHVGAFESLNDVVTEQQRVGNRLERKGMLRTRDHCAIGFRSQGDDQLVVCQLAVGASGRQANDAVIHVDALNGGLDEPGGLEKLADWDGARLQVESARKDLKQQRSHEHKVVPANQNDFNIRLSTKEPLQVPGSGNAAETAAENQDAFFEWSTAHCTTLASSPDIYIDSRRQP